jgi:hypothetical protein
LSVSYTLIDRNPINFKNIFKEPIKTGKETRMTKIVKNKAKPAPGDYNTEKAWK